MIYKSYLIEQNLNEIKEKLVLLYGENLGLKNELKKIRSHNKNSEIILLSQKKF